MLGTLVLIEVFLTLWLFSAMKLNEEEVHQQIFNSQAKEITASIQKEIAVNLGKLESLNALYDVSYPISRAQFSTFAGHLINSNSSLKALEWIPKINEGQRDSLERISVGNGPSGFRITENHGDQLYPASVRWEYYPVYYIEPYYGNEKALGFDLASNPKRMQAMEKANRIDEMVVTDPIDLAQDDFSSKGVIVFLPFKRNGELMGYFTGVFNLNELISQSLGDYLDVGFNLSIIDYTSENLIPPIYRSGIQESNGTEKEEIPFKYTGNVKVADREWTLHISPNQKQIDMQSSAYLLVLFLCIIISIALCNHLYQYFKSENLLLNILPASVAGELKLKGRVEAREYEAVSILFTDFMGFTEAASHMSAHELVSEINACFGAFDSIITRYGLEKIKTIGDAYIAAGGLSAKDDSSAKSTVLAALDMQQFISRRKFDHAKQGKIAFEMRIGIETGPIVAGIVGTNKFQYDIWGDTVNTANRLETQGEVCKVNISRNTFEKVKDDPALAFEYRGKIAVKGKGEMDMWFVFRKSDQPIVSKPYKRMAEMETEKFQLTDR